MTMALNHILVLNYLNKITLSIIVNFVSSLTVARNMQIAEVVAK